MPHPNGNGIHSYSDKLGDELRRDTRALKRSPATLASSSRVFLAFTVIVLALAGLFYLDDSFPGSDRQGNLASSFLGQEYDDDMGGSKDITVSRPHLVDTSPEPDSATIDPATGQLPLRKGLVISSYKDQDVSWLEELHRIAKG